MLESFFDNETVDDHIYDKRVAFVISAQHFIPYGGIGSFAKSFSEMAENLNWAVDYIFDKEPKHHDLYKFINNRHSMYYMNNHSSDYMSYNNHNSSFVFADSMNIERMLNFRNSFLKALENNIYDMILINSVDAVSPLYYTDLSTVVPMVYYTHSENLIFLDLPHNKVFTETSVEYMKKLMTLDGIYVGTQTQNNVDTIHLVNPDINAYSLGMRIPEQELLDDYDIDKSGVMFIGRFEPRKNPKLFADIIKAADLPAKILTNENGMKKFIEYFAKIGFDKYEIKANIIGKEKTEFIKSAKLGFHPANLESYGFSVFETLHSCRTFCLKEYTWWKNFKGLVELTSTKNAAQDLVKAYSEDFDINKRMELLRQYDKMIIEGWKEFLDKNQVRVYTKNKTILDKLLAEEDSKISLYNMYFTKLKRDSLAFDDVKSIYRKMDKLKITHFKNKSFLELKEKINE